MPNISDEELLELQRSVADLSALNEIANAINIAMSVQEITQTTMDHCVRRINAAQGAVFLLEDHGGQDKFKTFVREITPGKEKTPFHLNMTLSGWMMKNKTILVSNSPDTDSRFRGVNFGQLGITSLLAVPLLAREALMGLMVLFNKTGTGGFVDSDSRFLEIAASQTTKVIENARLFEKEQHLASLQKEIKIAQRIQQGFLPNVSIDDDTLEVVGSSTSAKDVGGDFFEIQRLSNGEVFVSLGDVAGKGIPAALLMSNAQAIVRSQLSGKEKLPLPALAENLNKLICQFTSPDQYLTSVFGCIDPVTGIFRFVNCGHLPVLVIGKNGNIKSSGDADLVIGVLPMMTFREQMLQLESGDLLCLYTDGVTECFNSVQEEYGVTRLHELLVKQNGNSAKDLVAALIQEIQSFRGGAEASDDVTLLALRVK